MDRIASYGGSRRIRDLKAFCKKTSETIGRRFVSPWEISKKLGCSFSDRDLEYLAKTFPEEEMAKVSEKENLILLPGPPVLSLLDIHACDSNSDNPKGMEQSANFNHISAMTWKEDEAIRNDLVSLGWMIFNRQPMFGGAPGIFPEREFLPGVAELAWILLACIGFVDKYPFKEVSLRTGTSTPDKNGKRFQVFLNHSIFGISVGMLDVSNERIKASNLAETFVTPV